VGGRGGKEKMTGKIEFEHSLRKNMGNQLVQAPVGSFANMRKSHEQKRAGLGLRTSFSEHRPRREPFSTTVREKEIQGKKTQD